MIMTTAINQSDRKGADSDGNATFIAVLSPSKGA